MLNKKTKVEMPKSKIVIRTIQNKIYVYHILQSYRNKKGQPTNKTVLIGRKDEETGMLIPNSKYYTIYEERHESASETTSEEDARIVQPTAVLDFGNNYVLDYLLNKFDVFSTLKHAFPSIYLDIATIAKYMVCEGNVFYYCEDWCEKTSVERIITSQKSTVICKNIDLDSRIKFFKRWVFAREKEEYLAYDITSISSYSRLNENVEWGYNRDEEKLPQINMGMVFGENTKIPVYYNVYPGSIPDKTYLDFMLKDSEMLGIKYSKLVMDRGFFTEVNVKKLENKTLSFIVGMPNHINISKRVINDCRGIQYESKNSLGAGKPFAKSVIIDDYGFRATVHVYFDPLKFNEDLEILYTNIEKNEILLKNLETSPINKNGLNKYFIFKENKDGSFDFVRNEKAIDESIKNCGYFLIFTTDFHLNSSEVLDIYRKKDVVEKCFDNLKNEIDMKRLRSHSKESTDGKIFIAFIALILRSILENKLKKFDKNYSIDKALKELSRIRIVKFENGQTLLNPLTKKQKEILEALNISIEELNNSVEKL